MNRQAHVNQWRIFHIEKPEPYLQLSFATSDGLLVKNLHLKHPRRAKTIAFLKSIGGEGSFRTLADLQEIIERAKFRPAVIEWQYSSLGEKAIVKITR
jgi:hypothetical protein